MPRVALGLTDEGPLGLGDDLVGQVRAVVVAVGEDERCLGEGVVAQAHDEQLGAEWLLGVPGGALALAPAALGAAGEVEHALPAEVLDRADPELLEVLLLEVLHRLHVDGLAAHGHRLDGAESDRATTEHDVQRCDEDVQVLGVQHDDEEHQHDADVQHQADVLEHLVGVFAEWFQRTPDEMRHERPVAVREVAGRSTGPAEQEHRPDDVEDHEQDHPRPAEVGTLEPGLAAEPLGRVLQPDGGEHGQADDGHDGDEVLGESEEVPVADQRDRESLLEQGPVGLEVDGGEDEERPEHEEVRGAGNGPLQQLLLAEHLDELRLEGLARVGPDVLDAVGGRLTAGDQAIQEPDALAGDRESDRVHHEAEHQDERHGRTLPPLIPARWTYTP